MTGTGQKRIIPVREPLPKKRSALPLPLLCKNSSGATAIATFLASQVATATATRYSLLYTQGVEGVSHTPKFLVTLLHFCTFQANLELEFWRAKIYPDFFLPF